MDLHRASSAPEWEQIEPKYRTQIQRIAYNTYGIVTPGNIVTVAGLLLLMYGLLILDTNTFLGLICIAIGRVFDLFDGLIAHKTATKSLLGEAFDSASDKIAIFLVLITYFLLEIVPTVYIFILAILQIITSIFVLRAKRNRKTIHTPIIGKHASFNMWIAIGFFSVVYILESDVSFYTVVLALSHIIMISAVVLNIFSTMYYIRAFHSALN